VKPGDLYKFRDDAFLVSSDYSHLNGKTLIVLGHVPPGCPPVTCGVNILVNGETSVWSTKILRSYTESIDETV
jgi:hypothetical protein